jgi:hypothetical protein
MIKKIYIGKQLYDSNPDLYRIAKCYEEHGKIKLVANYADADIIWKSVVTGLEEIIATDDKYAINAFPKNLTLTNKENLYKSILKFVPKKDIYKIIPKTWVIDDNNFNEIKKDIVDQLGENPLIIAKPVNLFGGIGIRVLRLADLVGPLNKKILIQEYIWDIKTIKHLTENFQVKFDIRVNLIMDNDGRIFIYKPFRARISDTPYKLTGKLDPLAHITNIDLRKIVTENAARDLQNIPELKIYEKPIIKFIKKYITKLIYKAVYVDPATHKTKYFQRIGLDLIILKNGDIRLLEINENPGNQSNYDSKKLDILQLIPFWFSDIGINPTVEQKKYFSVLKNYNP